ncbi:unnamed protein product [Prorocentrum cordatum]|uniref:Uncharacterized protein n=1 Tax=Prorocentrum cordatum TaxID=2364126 RepID=A0ABN9VLS3_9DINO|nr:unnamed protein product [Polarella glacialis]|mmetsp:Transcript_8406/g.22468  ORF Transcript_8406/g.22468 Transcript_8406/m.22468 type:complete len:212 (+) Transcript_8406:58-693(+)
MGKPTVLARPCGTKAPKAEPGAALRERLAAQADAALSSAEDNVLKRYVASGGAEGQLGEVEAALLEKPPAQQALCDNRAAVEENERRLRTAVESRDLKTLAEIDPRLRYLLETDDGMRAVQDQDLKDPANADALRLYQDAVTESRRPGKPSLAADAFKAVMSDDVQALEELIAAGLSLAVANGGGYTLLQLARERRKAGVEKLLVDSGAEN